MLHIQPIKIKSNKNASINKIAQKLNSYEAKKPARRQIGISLEFIETEVEEGVSIIEDAGMVGRIETSTCPGSLVFVVIKTVTYLPIVLINY